MFRNYFFISLFSKIRCIPWVIFPILTFFWSISFNYLELKRSSPIFRGFLEFGFDLNKNSSYFLTFCSLIGTMVIFFSSYYIKKEEVNSFSLSLSLFIMFILILTSRLNIFSMFLGWEGVGLISFLLIGWYSSRFWAGEGSKKAVLFNRVTDFFFLFLVVLEMGTPLWTFSLDSSNFIPYINFFPTFLLPLTFLLRALGKSAQFIFHPWLTSAIEGPTPVSSLLHRRTMVVAGVYLFLSFHPFLFRGRSWKITLLFFWILSRVTLLRRSLWAFSQEDVKKIVALSTTRQLRLMIILVCLNLPELAYLHIVLHGFFKALIFIGRGVCIHSGRNSQDFRNTNLSLSQKRLTLCFFLGNLGLIGFPFLGAFFRKHSLLEEIRGSLSLRSFILIICLFLSFSLTVGYRTKLLASTKATINLPIKAGGEGILAIFPLFLLTLFSLRGGLLRSIEDFLVSSKLLRRETLRKWNFFFSIVLGRVGFFLFKLNSFQLTFSFSSFRVLYLFFLNKFTKFLRDGLGEKILLLLALKKSSLVKWELISFLNSFRESFKIFSNIFSSFFSFLFLVIFLASF